MKNNEAKYNHDSICLIRVHMESLGDNDVSIVYARK